MFHQPYVHVIQRAPQHLCSTRLGGALKGSGLRVPGHEKIILLPLSLLSLLLVVVVVVVIVVIVVVVVVVVVVIVVVVV